MLDGLGTNIGRLGFFCCEWWHTFLRFAATKWSFVALFFSYKGLLEMLPAFSTIWDDQNEMLQAMLHTKVKIVALRGICCDDRTNHNHHLSGMVGQPAGFPPKSATWCSFKAVQRGVYESSLNKSPLTSTDKIKIFHLRCKTLGQTTDTKSKPYLAKAAWLHHQINIKKTHLTLNVVFNLVEFCIFKVKVNPG